MSHAFEIVELKLFDDVDWNNADGDGHWLNHMSRSCQNMHLVQSDHALIIYGNVSRWFSTVRNRLGNYNYFLCSHRQPWLAFLAANNYQRIRKIAEYLPHECDRNPWRLIPIIEILLIIMYIITVKYYFNIINCY